MKRDIGGLNATTVKEKDKDRALGSALDGLRQRVSTFRLANGMQWIVLERHVAQIVACHTYADVGAADESDGMTGVAHLLEHLAFKGTVQVGTRDAAAEALMLDQQDEVFYEMRAARERGDLAALQPLSKRFAELQESAAALTVPNEYGAILSRQGGVGLNAQTSQDSTEYYVSLPSNKLELWMALESGRFIAPVFRGLYAEKEVVKEERRLRVDNSPLGRFTEAFSEVAFPEHPYGRPVIGYPSDFERIGRREVDAFFRQRYNPRSLTCAVVGDVDPAEVERLAERYFGGWEPPATTLEAAAAPQAPPGGAATWREGGGWDALRGVRGGEDRRTLRMALQANPFYMEGYYRPSAASTDDPAMSVLAEILSGGRGSRFYKRVILPGKALTASASESFPGHKYPNLMLMYSIPPTGGSTDDVAQLLHHELEDLVSNGVTADELVPIRKASKAGLLEAFGSHSGMAKLLCQYSTEAGSWAALLEESNSLEAVTEQEVQRVAARLFVPSNRVAGHVRMRSPIQLPFPVPSPAPA